MKKLMQLFLSVTIFSNFGAVVIACGNNNLSDNYYVGTEEYGLGQSSNGVDGNPTAGNFPSQDTISSAIEKISKNYFASTKKDGLGQSYDGINGTQVIGLGAWVQSSVVKIDDFYYLGTINNGLYRSSDGLNGKSVSDLVNVPIESKIVKLGNNYYASSLNKGLGTSKDGINGKQVNSTDNLLNSTQIQDAPVQIDGFYYVGTDDHGLGTSHDVVRGSQVTGGLPTNINIDAGLTKIADRYYVSSDDGLGTSTDGVNGAQNKSLSNITLAKAPVQIGDTYYLTSSESPTNGLYTSQDGIKGTKNNSFSKETAFYSLPVKLYNTYYLSSFGIADGAGGLGTSTDGVHGAQIKNQLLENAVILEPVVYLS